MLRVENKVDPLPVAGYGEWGIYAMTAYSLMPNCDPEKTINRSPRW